ncbi:M1 family metallopeptidase [Conexibacter stalactiti]|uniref:Aminopeptidase N n=1 Tax=Conexibacter stalactiti TaxID=1940611 RepID=A0ABU4HNG1_9ACTN|nr:M1 family metallopeptidase [Conexibacter stalactiti]MDW5593584.1 M1 family metallopeptidase [Conexibacter stalactiti]MEC5034225.1 M1 family metallopeptidase [Conexibacter stalactiti]
MTRARSKVSGGGLAAAVSIAICLGLSPAGAPAAPTAVSALSLAPTRSPLLVGDVRASDTMLVARQRFVVRGTVVNRGSRARPAQLQLLLRSGGRRPTVHALGGARIASIGAGRRRTFAVRVMAPTLKAAVAKGFELRVCVRPRRGSRAVDCATAARRVRVAFRAPRPAPRRQPAPLPPRPTPPGPPPSKPPVPPAFLPGARTAGDSLFPTIGNGGYDVRRYDLDLAYTDVFARMLHGTATIDAVATQNLSEFSLDLQGLAIGSVSVAGRSAPFTLDFAASKLIVTPSAGIVSGTAFTVQVNYSGVPEPVIDPDGSMEGWLSNVDFGSVALGEPLGSQGWFPVNNVPTDKATYDISVTAPSGFAAVANGVLDGTTANPDGTTTYDWTSDDLMAPYLATVSIGRFDSSGSDLRGPRPLYIYVDQSFRRAEIVADQQRVPEILDWYAGYYGVPYPFDAAGAVVPRVGADIGYVLETQTKPTYPSSNADSSGVGMATIAHENAHQWFGNLVTLARWRDIWLNEGITEFSSWLWGAAVEGDMAPMGIFDYFYTADAAAEPDFWLIPPADPPTAGDIFNTEAMYSRGAMTMTAIREVFIATPALGEDAFRAMMRSWLTDHANGNVTTEQFIALVKATDPARAALWDQFFQQWLYTSYTGDPTQPGNKPDITPGSF